MGCRPTRVGMDLFEESASRAIWNRDADTGAAWDMFLDLRDGSKGLQEIQEKIDYQVKRASHKK